MSRKRKKTKVFAVSSGGGHWIQMLRLRPALQGCDVTYLSVQADAAQMVAPARFHTISDGNRDTKVRLVLMAVKILLLMLWGRPDVVISTGAAPGYFACRFARIVGARSLFIDSVANAEELSLSAKLATSHANRVFTQSPKVAGKHNLPFHGSVL